MAGTRTAPDLTGTATALQLTLHFIDDSGDIWSEAHLIPIASTPAQREAYVDTMQLSSGASIYKIDVESQFGTDGLADPTNAEPDADLLKSRSVFDGVNITLKHTTDPEKKNKVVRVPAPIATIMQVDGEYVSDQIDVNSVELVNLMAATVAMFGAGWAVAWARYTERKEINQKTRI